MEENLVADWETSAAARAAANELTGRNECLWCGDTTYEVPNDTAVFHTIEDTHKGTNGCWCKWGLYQYRFPNLNEARDMDGQWPTAPIVWTMDLGNEVGVRLYYSTNVGNPRWVYLTLRGRSVIPPITNYSDVVGLVLPWEHYSTQAPLVDRQFVGQFAGRAPAKWRKVRRALESVANAAPGWVRCVEEATERAKSPLVDNFPHLVTALSGASWAMSLQLLGQALEMAPLLAPSPPFGGEVARQVARRQLHAYVRSVPHMRRALRYVMAERWRVPRTAGSLPDGWRGTAPYQLSVQVDPSFGGVLNVPHAVEDPYSARDPRTKAWRR